MFLLVAGELETVWVPSYTTRMRCSVVHAVSLLDFKNNFICQAERPSTAQTSILFKYSKEQMSLSVLRSLDRALPLLTVILFVLIFSAFITCIS
jgi:hypothetical protein